MAAEQHQFWKTKTFKEMTQAEWDSLCDGCGLCCLHNFRDAKTGKTKHIAVSCRYLDTTSCRCRIYEDRSQVNPDCLLLSPYKIRQIKKLPYSCAYRSLVEGRELKWWHPLISGNPNTVHDAGVSVRNKVVSGNHVHQDDLEYFYHN